MPFELDLEKLKNAKRKKLIGEANQRNQASAGTMGASIGDLSGTGAQSLLTAPVEPPKGLQAKPLSPSTQPATQALEVAKGGATAGIKRRLGDVQVEQFNQVNPDGSTTVKYVDASGKVLGELTGFGPGVKRLAEAGIDPSKRGTVSFIDTKTAADAAEKEVELAKLDAIKRGDISPIHINTPASEIIARGGVNSRFAQGEAPASSLVPSTAGTSNAVLTSENAKKNLDRQISKLVSDIADANPVERNALTQALKTLTDQRAQLSRDIQADAETQLEQAAQAERSAIDSRKVDLEQQRLLQQGALAEKELSLKETLKRQAQEAEAELAREKANQEVNKRFTTALNKNLTDLAKLEDKSVESVGPILQSIISSAETPQQRSTAIKQALRAAKVSGVKPEELQTIFPGLPNLARNQAGKALLAELYGEDFVNLLINQR